MKSKLNLSRWLVLTAFLLTGVHQANAWYSPSQQRWINRDPIAERGFELAFKGRTLRHAGDPNQYVYAENDPVNNGDSLGLQSIIPPGPLIIIPCPGSIQFIFCVMYCAERGQGVPIGLPLCALGADGRLYVGCPCSGVFKKPRKPPLACS